MRDLNGDQADGRGRSRTLNVKGIQLDDLSEIQVLGEGSFGRVTLVQDVNRSEDQSSMGVEENVKAQTGRFETKSKCNERKKY